MTGTTGGTAVSTIFDVPVLGWNPISLVVNGDYLYATANEDFILDISNPTSPSFVKKFAQNTLINRYTRKVTGDLMCSLNEEEFKVTDISDPTNPGIIDTLTITGASSNSSIAISGNVAYVSSDQLYAIDLS